MVRVGGWQGATGNFVLDSSFSNVLDCNGNGRPDDEDIAGGVSEDCNGSMIPDECEIDATTDCDGNAILDECEHFQTVTTTAFLTVKVPAGPKIVTPTASQTLATTLVERLC